MDRKPFPLPRLSERPGQSLLSFDVGRVELERPFVRSGRTRLLPQLVLPDRTNAAPNASQCRDVLDMIDLPLEQLDHRQPALLVDQHALQLATRRLKPLVGSGAQALRRLVGIPKLRAQPPHEPVELSPAGHGPALVAAAG
jgi:hypothetical protein